MGIDPHFTPERDDTAQFDRAHTDWITFTESDSDSGSSGAQRRWVVDASFLSSNYRCIWGDGCQGVLAEPSPELMQGCCSYGAHLVDDDDLQRLVRAYVRATPFMQFADTARREGFLRRGDEGPDSTATRVVDGACIFFNRPTSEPDNPDRPVGCALHLAAVAADESPLDWKPNVCWQIPIKLHRGTDADAQDIITMRAWRRSDWENAPSNPAADRDSDDDSDDEAGDEMAWWCTESAEAFSGTEPLYQSARAELIELMGEHAYRLMVEQIERQARLSEAAATTDDSRSER